MTLRRKTPLRPGRPIARKRMKQSKRKPESQVRSEYREKHWFCEVAYFTGLTFTTNGVLVREHPGIVVEGIECNHIFSIGRRPDVRSNLISLSPSAHRWFHAHLNEGRVLCLYAKMLKAEKTGDWSECDMKELDSAAGKSVTGWLSGLEFDEDDWIFPIHDELILTLQRSNA